MVIKAVRSRAPAVGSPLLMLIMTNNCSGFLLQSSLIRSTPHRIQTRQSRPFVAGTSSALRRPRVIRLPFINSTAREHFIRVGAEPEEAVTEKGSAGEQQSIPEGEEVLDGEDGPPPLEIEAGTRDTGDAEGEIAAQGADLEVEEEVEEEEEEEDPMAEIKLRIKELEKDLQDEENRLADIRDSAQEKGQMGFLRMAAQVDNYRKKSGKGTGEYEADAKAAVLRAVLPAFAPFEEAEEKLTLETENEIKFNSNYQALYRQLKEVYAKIGASDFYGVVGENFESRRHEKVSEEHNEIMSAGRILECLSPGLELRTNIIRKAACVVSLGPEKTESPEEGSAEGGADEAKGELRDAGAVGEGELDAEEGPLEEKEAPAEEEPTA